MYSVIIPTIQRSDLLVPMLERYVADPVVGEVVIVNNAQVPLDLDSPKVRVLQQEENIFVNPAWNLGVAASRFPLLAIANDDLLFDSSILARAAELLRRPGVALVGPDSSCFGASPDEALAFRPAYQRQHGFGTLMLMRRERYIQIPEELRIWFGDDYLFNHQRRRNWLFKGLRIETPMGVSSSRPEFLVKFEAERAAYRTRYTGRYAENYRIERRAYLGLVAAGGFVRRLVRTTSSV